MTAGQARQLDRLRHELEDTESKCARLQDEIDTHVAEIQRKQRSVDLLRDEHHETERVQQMLRQQISVIAQDGASHATGTNLMSSDEYQDMDFDWSGGLEHKMRTIFKIKELRLCQRGACNAVLDGRDVLCIMPTGGGKSLTYQLPALLNPGCTLVISPLKSLIHDQLLYLRELGIRAEMLTGDCTVAETDATIEELEGISLKSKKGEAHEGGIKLLYCPPEKIMSSEKVLQVFKLLSKSKRLVRIVIDEAQVVGEATNDYRQAYRKLGKLRENCPEVPILLLSATCPPKVRMDLLETLHMPPICPGGTVLFQAPLYRRNLHYTVIPRLKGRDDIIQDVADYICQNYPQQSGIIYCMTKKETENVAAGITEKSAGTILTGVYHGDIKPKVKDRLHESWRVGKVHVICATNAFGMGIDKPDVRFVMHYSMPKSLDGYYQESGRAGRDGEDADCILYARPQDLVRQVGITKQTPSGQSQLLEMVKFVQDTTECRKILFAQYFLDIYSISLDLWSTSSESIQDRCGHCDNCAPLVQGLTKKENVTVDAWRIMRLVAAMEKFHGIPTLNGLAELCRGSGKMTVSTWREGHSEEGGTKDIDLLSIIDSKVTLRPKETAHLIASLICSRHLNAEAVLKRNQIRAHVAIKLGFQSRHYVNEQDKDQVQRLHEQIFCTFPISPKKRLRLEEKFTGSDMEVVRDDGPLDPYAGTMGTAVHSAPGLRTDRLEDMLSNMANTSESEDEADDDDIIEVLNSDDTVHTLASEDVDQAAMTLDEESEDELSLVPGHFNERSVHQMRRTLTLSDDDDDEVEEEEDDAPISARTRGITFRRPSTVTLRDDAPGPSRSQGRPVRNSRRLSRLESDGGEPGPSTGSTSLSRSRHKRKRRF